MAMSDTPPEEPKACLGLRHPSTLLADPLSMTVTIRQDPLSLTLDGPAIFALAVSLIFSVHFFQRDIVALIIGFITSLLFIQHDYRNYLNLGPGGTPATFKGYLTVCEYALRYSQNTSLGRTNPHVLIQQINWLKLWALRDPFRPLPVDPKTAPAAGILLRKPLPYRCGPRPQVVGIAPQRQVNQFGSRECYLSLRKILQNHAAQHPENLGTGTSCFEKHGIALFSRYPFNKSCQGEIVHVHDSDHSMHMTLHPEDAKEVLEKGWGQRHPLTSQCLLKMPVPLQFTMVYAPRTRDELQVICRIIQAASWYITAEEMKMDLLEEA
ncbi:hypothetical protein F4778DRAFT_115635 [Xylariomycetidae sp. FL2044]|nr:hypothetical protein F4778DRAFT_115635 [Xylariomycetidae sp. FL2044]